MRKTQKNQILEIIDSLQQAHEEIRMALQKKDNDPTQDQAVLRMLGECQETAVSIGEAIEKTEGTEHITVSYLEEYCELLFRIYEEINGGNNGDDQICKSLRRQLIKIENSVKNDIRVRKEIAFFPYQASMWDSLESIYLAARKDPDCDAYCVPIPYYDLKPDHSFGEMHYEGSVDADGIPVMYPKNIEIIDWQTYNFEERRPDEIYIHNGYDNWNLVTSVHPRFYAKNLKKYTDKLVYIPYFVLGEIEPDDQAAVDSMKHFCFMPGTIYADQVVVQSEKMRQIYINEYIKAAKEVGFSGEHTDRKFLEKKFLGTGSPKIDKLLNTKKEDLEIPAEWLRIIEKPDGSWKKIVFYNTSVSALLHNNEKMLRKMESVFEIFKEKQDEVALLWRPHPLIQATIKSMRPQLWEEYQKIKGRYIEEGWGIYDDSSDLDRAVVMSDAYYGDYSSVVQLCRKIGKTIILQDCNVQRKYRKSLLVSTWILLEDDIYFAIANGNALFRCNIGSGDIVFLGCFPDEDKTKCELYRGSVMYKQYLVFFPYNAKKTGIYDIKGNVFVENMWHNLPKKGYYTQMTAGDTEDIYIFGAWSNPYIYRFDPVRDEGYYILPTKEMGHGAKLGRMDMGGLWRTDSYIYFPVFERECIIAFDLVNETLEEISLPERGYHYIAIALIGNLFYLLEDSGKLVSYDCSSKELKLMFDVEQYVKSDITGTVYNKFLCDEKYLYLIPERYGEAVVRYDCDTEEIYFMDKIVKKDVSYGMQKGRKSLARICNKKLISFCNETLSLEITDLLTSEQKEINLPDTDAWTVPYGFNNGIVSETWGAVPLIEDILNK